MYTYDDYLSENLDKNVYIEYTNYIAEHLKSQIDYSEYIAKNLQNNIEYTEYIAEKLSYIKTKQDILRKDRINKLNNLNNLNNINEK